MCIACARCATNLCGQITLRIMDFGYFIPLMQVQISTGYSPPTVILCSCIDIMSLFILVIYSWVTATEILVELRQQLLHLLTNWLEFTRAVGLLVLLLGPHVSVVN